MGNGLAEKRQLPVGVGSALLFGMLALLLVLPLGAQAQNTTTPVTVIGTEHGDQTASGQAVAEPDSPAYATGPYYSLYAYVRLMHNYVTQMAWLDTDRYLTLVVSVDGAALWLTSCSTSTREKFMSSQFIHQHICPARYTANLRFQLSPSKRYLYYSWPSDSGGWNWALVDISSAPTFKLKRFNLPPGMQVSRALFSPDDRDLVLVHDAYADSSDTSVLALDLLNGAEHWRINAGRLNFIKEAWWSSAVYEPPQFKAAAGRSSHTLASSRAKADASRTGSYGTRTTASTR